AKPASAARSSQRDASLMFCGSPRPSAKRAPISYSAAGSLASAAVRSGEPTDAGSASMSARPPLGAAGLRGIEPVTWGSLMAVLGSKNDDGLLIELVLSGPLSGAAAPLDGGAPPGVGIGRLGVVVGAWSFGAPSGGLCD